MAGKIRVLLVEENVFARVGIQAIIENEEKLELIGEVDGGSAVYQLCKNLLPDVLLIDSALFTESIESLMSLHNDGSKMSVILLCDRNGNCTQNFITQGISGCIFGDEAPDTLIHAIYTVAQGHTWFPKSLVEKTLKHKTGTVEGVNELGLSKREQEILSMIAKGWSNAKIATELCLATQTVRNYVSSIYSKLSVGSRAEAIAWIVRNGFLR